MLKDTPLEPNFPLRLLAEHSVGRSGSDLRELCRNAAMLPVREYVRNAAVDQAALAKGQLEGFKLRPLRIEDFFTVEGEDIAAVKAHTQNGVPAAAATGQDRARIDEPDVPVGADDDVS